jgi:hypothetical protein
MFQKDQLTVVDWWLFFILMFIPLINIVVFFLLILNSGTNKTLKNYLLAGLIPVILIIGLVLFTGIGAAILDSI